MEDAVDATSDDQRLQKALSRYEDGAVGMRGAAEIAGLTIAEMTHEANERGVMMQYHEADREDDADALT